MASLQGTLEYQGNLDQVFISNFDVAIHTPKFLYTTTANTEYEYFGRQLDGYAISTRTLGLRERTYHFDLPVESIIGEQTNSQYGFFRYHRIEPLKSGNIDDFVFDIKYVVSDEYGNEIGEQEFKAIYGFQSSLNEIDRRHKDELYAYIQRLGSFGSINLPSLQNFIQNEKNKIFIINKEAYDDLREQLQQHVGNNNDFYLLHLIEGLVDLSSRQPKAVRNINSSRQDGLFRILRDAEVDESQYSYILELTIQFFNRLFSFPILLPEIEVINIGGTFSILSNETLTRDNLEFYSLSVEYPQKDSALKIIRYNWHENSAELVNNRIIFSFTNDQLITLGSIDNVLSVKVKGFDGSLLWNKEFYPPDTQLERLEIEVPAYRPNAIKVSSISGRPASIKRLRGKVVQFGNKYSLNELTVVIQAKRDGDEIWRIVGATTTDKSGNFSLEYPYGRYVEAQALVSLMPNSPANIEANPENSTNETISDNFIYLLLQDSEIVPPEEPKKVKDCDCGTPNITKRLPDQTDLIESGEYTQDIGGTCLNLSTPNRTLREYSYNAIVRTSDPDVANYILQKSEEGNTVKYALVGGSQKIQRGIVDLDNPIRWEDAPDAKSNLSLYQAVTVATGHILYFKSVFKADGYSLGDLVYSLPLAPGQKKQIVVFESSHALTGAESQTLSQGERLSAELINDRSITDQLSGAIGEDLSGRSSASTGGISAGLGVGGSLGGIGGSLGVAGGYANSRSDASQNSSRNISQFFGEKLRQSIMQNAESYRQLNASVVTTVTQGQNYGVTSEVVANHNHCHSMTLMYFDVLRHYAIFQEVSHVEECVFVPLLMTHFTSENIHKWKDILAQYLLPMPSSTYLQPYSFLLKGRQHPLLKAFDANERIKTRYARVDFPPEGETYADGVITQIMGQFSMNVNIPRPKTRYDRIKSLPVITKTVSRQEIDVEGTVKRNALAAAGGPLGFFFAGTETRTIQEEIQVVGQIFDQFMILDANYASVPPANCIRVINFSPRSVTLPDGTTTSSGETFFDGGHIDRQLWTGYAKILGYVGTDGVYEMLDYYFSGRLISEWDEIFYKDILPLIFAKIVDSISIHWGEVKTERVGEREVIIHSGGGFNLDFSTDTRYSGGNRTINVRFSSQEDVGKKRSELLRISISSSNPDAITLKNHITLNIGKVSINYTTAYFSGSLYSGYINDDLLDGTNIATPLNSREKISPRKEDIYIVSQLIEHLNSNLEYYNKVLWYNLDPDRRFMLLDGFTIEIFYPSGTSAGFRSLASVLKNELITIAGNSLVFPVADGYKVNQSYILENTEENDEQEVSLLDYYKPLTPIPPYRVSVPTRGVFMEAIQGACDSCEMVKENSSQDWDKFRTEEPTPISPVITPVPTITSYTPNYKDFAPPLVNIQNAPDAPAPAAGLSQLTELLGKAGVFNDITGLQGNQRNVLETYLSNQANAKAFAEMAKSLATQQHNTQNSPEVMERLEQARESGAIGEEDYRNLTRQHLQQQIDGGESLRESAQLERERNRPSLTDAAIDAVGQGQSVQAERTDPDGNRESIRVSERQEGGSTVNIRHEIDPIRQPNTMACWATAATMMVNWKNRSSSSIEEVLRSAGNNLVPPDENHFLNMFTSNTGLAADEKDRFISALGMLGEAPANYLLNQYVEWLRNYGPLWVTTDANPGAGFSPHARILFGINGDVVNNPNQVNFTFSDPADGREVSETFERFIHYFEQIARERDPEQELLIQIVHFRDRLQQATEGGGPGRELYRSTSIGNSLRAGDTVQGHSISISGDSQSVQLGGRSYRLRKGSQWGVIYGGRNTPNFRASLNTLAERYRSEGHSTSEFKALAALGFEVVSEHEGRVTAINTWDDQDFTLGAGFAAQRLNNILGFLPTATGISELLNRIPWLRGNRFNQTLFRSGPEHLDVDNFHLLIHTIENNTEYYAQLAIAQAQQFAENEVMSLASTAERQIMMANISTQTIAPVIGVAGYLNHGRPVFARTPVEMLNVAISEGGSDYSKQVAALFKIYLQRVNRTAITLGREERLELIYDTLAARVPNKVKAFNEVMRSNGYPDFEFNFAAASEILPCIKPDHNMELLDGPDGIRESPLRMWQNTVTEPSSPNISINYDTNTPSVRRYRGYYNLGLSITVPES